MGAVPNEPHPIAIDWVPVFRPLRVVPFLAVLALPMAATQLPPVRAAIIALVDAMRDGGPVGAAMFVGSYALGAVFTAPIALFAGMAGYVYGPVRGILLASPASVVAATTAFLVGRFMLAARIKRWTRDSPRWSAIDRAVAGEPFRIAVLLRLTPIAPQNFLSYGLSLTRVKVRTFMLATWLGLLPITCFQVYVGSLVRDVTELLDNKRAPGAWGYAALVAGLLVSALAAFITARIAQKALAKSGV